MSIPIRISHVLVCSRYWSSAIMMCVCLTVPPLAACSVPTEAPAGLHAALEPGGADAIQPSRYSRRTARGRSCEEDRFCPHLPSPSLKRRSPRQPVTDQCQPRTVRGPREILSSLISSALVAHSDCSGLLLRPSSHLRGAWSSSFTICCLSRCLMLTSNCSWRTVRPDGVTSARPGHHYFKRIGRAYPYLGTRREISVLYFEAHSFPRLPSGRSFQT